MNIKKISLIGGLLCGMALWSCQSTGGIPTPPEQRIVLTTQSQVNPATPAVEVAAFPIEALPKEVVATLGASESNPTVLTARGNLNPPPEDDIFIPVPEDLNKETWLDVATNPSVWGSIATAIGGVAGNAVPYIAGLEALLLLFSKRKRMHYMEAGAQLAHGDPLEMTKSLGRALGAAHSSEKSKKVAERV